MGDKLLEVIKQVGIFMICAQMILHFRPSESYNKYIKLLISIMVLVQLMFPVMEIFGGGMDGFYGKLDYYNGFITGSMEDANITALNAETLLNEMTMEEVKTRINNSQEAQQPQEAQQGGQMGEALTIQIDRIEVNAGE